jgi:hypothetical protein
MLTVCCRQHLQERWSRCISAFKQNARFSIGGRRRDQGRPQADSWTLHFRSAAGCKIHMFITAALSQTAEHTQLRT